MRVYASVLGVLLTIGSLYLMQLAVASAGFDRLAERSRGVRMPGELWYGGVLDPITIEVARATLPALAFGAPWMLSGERSAGQKAVESGRLARPKRHAIISSKVPASMGSMM